MDLKSNWKEIKKHFNKCFRTNFHVAVASVDKDNNPTVTPIGSLFLNNNGTGYYFEKYPTKLPIHAEQNRNICILSINSNTWFWLKSLVFGKFNSHPALKLYGTLGNKREATTIEIERLKRRVKHTNGLKGNSYLWGTMAYVREIEFTRVEKINLGSMTQQL
jgi:hypothetical protein